jgi:hypothetical protein
VDAIIVAIAWLSHFSTGTPNVILRELMLTTRTALISSWITIAVFISWNSIVAIFASLWLIPTETHVRRFSAAIFTVVCAYIRSATLSYFWFFWNNSIIWATLIGG